MAAGQAEEAETDSGGARVIAISDRVLLERHRRGDPDAFPALVAAFRAPVFGYLTRCGVASADRDDLFQEVFLRVHRAAGPDGTSELPTGPVAPWLFTIAVNLVRSHFRKTSVRKVMTLDAEAGTTTASDATPPDRALESREKIAWLEAAMAKLPLEQREALVLSTIEGLEIAEVAAALDVPADTVKTRVRRARLALAEARARANVRAEREEAR
jgi:RNA polymerase sigma-70 factor (ECF subfamily)